MFHSITIQSHDINHHNQPSNPMMFPCSNVFFFPTKKTPGRRSLGPWCRCLAPPTFSSCWLCGETQISPEKLMINHGWYWSDLGEAVQPCFILFYHHPVLWNILYTLPFFGWFWSHLYCLIFTWRCLDISGPKNLQVDGPVSTLPKLRWTLRNLSRVKWVFICHDRGKQPWETANVWNAT